MDFAIIPSEKKIYLNLRLERIIVLFLIISTIGVYFQVRTHEFSNIDDNVYVVKNPYVTSGINSKSIKWAFSSIHENWHPITWLSHMLDFQLYGMKAGGHHLTNLLFHLINTLLLFGIFRQMTGALWRSAFLALFFALHPLHVESVAWVSERKDVLSTCFWLLTMWSYVKYVEKKEIFYYFMTLILYCFGLMAKPMVVTLPFVMLLLDYWPLERFKLSTCHNKNMVKQRKDKAKYHLLIEKIPFFILSAASCVITIYGQRSSGALGTLEQFSLTTRIENAIVSYAIYIGQLIYPVNLSVFYPYIIPIALWKVYMSFLLICGLVILSVLGIRKHPYCIVGVFWYVGTLLPVIGLVQVGSQARADRYTYIPAIGIFIVISWFFHELLENKRYLNQIINAFLGVFILTVVMCVTWIQIGYWSNSISLFEHTVKTTQNNSFAHNNLGISYARKGKLNEAIDNYNKAIRINPNDPKFYNNLGSAFLVKKELYKAIHELKKALVLDSKYADAYYNIGIAYYMNGRIDDAISNYMKSIKYNPYNAKAHTNLGIALKNKGLTNEAVMHFGEELKINRYLPEANYHFANALFEKGKYELAIIYCRRVLKVLPGHEGAKKLLRNAIEKKASKDMKSK